MDPAEGGKFLWRLQRRIGVEHPRGAPGRSHRRECGADPASIRRPRFHRITVFCPMPIAGLAYLPSVRACQNDAFGPDRTGSGQM